MSKTIAPNKPKAPANDNGIDVSFDGVFPPPISADELVLMQTHASELIAILSEANDNDRQEDG